MKTTALPSLCCDSHLKMDALSLTAI